MIVRELTKMSGESDSVPPAETAYLLDTGILIFSFRGDATITSRIASESMLYTSSIVLGELYHGAYGSPHEADDVRSIDELTQRLTILPVDIETAKDYGRIKREQRIKGRMLPENDMWIAATAIQYGITLAGRDVHFTWIDRLNYEQW
jgi:tRNA(fMet)-specific endonuclease VapC